MKICIALIAPVFPKAFHGGSTRVLVDVARSLGNAGHDVNIYCTARRDNNSVFNLAPRVSVHPVLRFKETYPEPYYVPPYQLAEIIDIISNAVGGADVVYLHDGEVSFKFLFDNRPTVASFQDFVYPDTVGNAMSFDYSDLIVASEYVRACVLDSIGQYRGTIESRLHVVPNGIDLDHFRPAEPLPWQRSLKDEGHVLIGYPHRPDPKKGLIQAIATLNVLKRRLPEGREPFLLVPRWMDSHVMPDDGHVYRTIYDDAITFAESIGLKQNIIIHDWLDDLLPQYYSGCDVTLSLGTFVEAFGNVPLESLACGCPSVVVSVGAHAGKLPVDYCTEVVPGDIDAAADAVLSRLATPLVVHEVRSYLSTAFGLRQMCDGYRKVIEGAQIRAPLPLRQPSDLGGLRMPAWCRFFGTRLYNDYEHGYCPNEQVRELVMRVCQSQQKQTRSDSAATALENGVLETALRGGYLVRC